MPSPAIMLPASRPEKKKADDALYKYDLSIESAQKQATNAQAASCGQTFTNKAFERRKQLQPTCWVLRRPTRSG